MGLAISKSLKLLDDTSTSLDETFNYLDDGYVNEFYNSWHNIDISDKVDEIINHLENFSDADDAMFIILVINNGYDPENSNHTIDSNSDVEVIPFHSINAAMVLEISDGMINGAQAITDFPNNLYSNMDQIIDVDLNPNYLDFSDFEIEDNPSFWNDPALIDVFKASNPNWLSLTDEGIEWFHNGGDDLENAFKEINSFITELDDISQEQDVTLIFDDDFDNIKDLSEQLYNDFANPSSTTVINDENVNLSAWFDYPPISFLTLWENVVLGTDSTLYCLFPDRSSMIFLCNNVSEYDLGDVNGDGSINVQDIVRIINVIVGNASFSLEQMNLADINQDENLNILDAVQLINMIMGYDDELLSRSNSPTHLDISLSGNSIRIPSDGAFGGLQLITEGQYSITETQLPEGLELYKGYQGIVIINLTGSCVSVIEY
jgi:hypothetical protein